MAASSEAALTMVSLSSSSVVESAVVVDPTVGRKRKSFASGRATGFPSTLLSLPSEVIESRASYWADVSLHRHRCRAEPLMYCEELRPIADRHVLISQGVPFKITRKQKEYQDMLCTLNAEWPDLPETVRQQRKTELADLIEYMVRRKSHTDPMSAEKAAEQVAAKKKKEAPKPSEEEQQKIKSEDDVPPAPCTTVMGRLRRRRESFSSNSSTAATLLMDWCVELPDTVSFQLRRQCGVDEPSTLSPLTLAIGNVTQYVKSGDTVKSFDAHGDWYDSAPVQFEIVHARRYRGHLPPPLHPSIPFVAMHVLPVQHLVRNSRIFLLDYLDRFVESGCVKLSTTGDDARFFLHHIDIRLKPSDVQRLCHVDARVIDGKLISIHPVSHILGQCAMDKFGRITFV